MSQWQQPKIVLLSSSRGAAGGGLTSVGEATKVTTYRGPHLANSMYVIIQDVGIS